MYKFPLSLICCLVVTYLPGHRCKSVGLLMRNTKIVPWVFPSFPNETCRVSFPYFNIKSAPGSELEIEKARMKAPKVRWNARKNRYYTMMMISPDIPELDGTKYAEYDEWVVVNIYQRQMRTGQVLKNYNITEKPRRNGTIYYVFMIFEQPEFIYLFEEMIDLGHPNQFRLEAFVYKYNMSGPVAGNFYAMKYPAPTTPAPFTGYKKLEGPVTTASLGYFRTTRLFRTKITRDKFQYYDSYEEYGPTTPAARTKRVFTTPWDVIVDPDIIEEMWNKRHRPSTRANQTTVVTTTESTTYIPHVFPKMNKLK